MDDEPVIIAPTGELDLSASRGLATQLNEAAGIHAAVVVIDLSEVSFIDSTGLSAVVHADARLRRNDRRLRIVAPAGSAAAELIELSGLTERMAIFRSRDAALSTLAA